MCWDARTTATACAAKKKEIRHTIKNGYEATVLFELLSPRLMKRPITRRGGALSQGSLNEYAREPAWCRRPPNAGAHGEHASPVMLARNQENRLSLIHAMPFVQKVVRALATRRHNEAIRRCCSVNPVTGRRANVISCTRQRCHRSATVAETVQRQREESPLASRKDVKSVGSNRYKTVRRRLAARHKTSRYGSNGNKVGASTRAPSMPGVVRQTVVGVIHARNNVAGCCCHMVDVRAKKCRKAKLRENRQR